MHIFSDLCATVDGGARANALFHANAQHACGHNTAEPEQRLGIYLYMVCTRRILYIYLCSFINYNCARDAIGGRANGHYYYGGLGGVCLAGVEMEMYGAQRDA